LICIPGARPVKVPAIMPTISAIMSSIIIVSKAPFWDFVPLYYFGMSVYTTYVLILSVKSYFVSSFVSSCCTI
jgi:hypothetical protein